MAAAVSTVAAANRAPLSLNSSGTGISVPSSAFLGSSLKKLSPRHTNQRISSASFKVVAEVDEDKQTNKDKWKGLAFDTSDDQQDITRGKGMVDSLFQAPMGSGTHYAVMSSFDYVSTGLRQYNFDNTMDGFYIAPAFMDKLVVHITKNYMTLPNIKVPLILGIWGGKGQGKSFQCELVFSKMGINPIMMSAGELESGNAGEPAKLIRQRYRESDEDLDAEIDWALKQAGNLVLDCSEIGDDRPLSGCSFSHDGKLLVTSALSGVAKVWSMPHVRKVTTLKGHTERATDVAFSPEHEHLVTASADRTARLWNYEGSLLRTFEGHLDRLARIGFHPSGKYLGTTSFDKTWRLWDIDTGVELLLQEGHSRSVYGISFHRDGSLVASCGLDALARVWDLRTGRSILALEGHVKPILGISFSPNGYHLATGGEDNTCRIWDLRKKKSLYVIPAHSNLISQVKFEPQEGYFLATSSYDMTAKVWSARDFKPVKTLSGHEAKVTSLDIMGDGQQIATVAHDRTIKLWSGSANAKENTMDVD